MEIFEAGIYFSDLQPALRSQENECLQCCCNDGNEKPYLGHTSTDYRELLHSKAKMRERRRTLPLQHLHLFQLLVQVRVPPPRVFT